MDDVTASVVLRSSFAAAHACAEKIDKRAQEVFQSANRKRLRKIFARIAKCGKRMPAFRRHALDRKLCAMLCRETIDSETIEGLIEALITAFSETPRSEPSLTVLRVLTQRSSAATILDGTNTARMHRKFAEAARLLREDYSALPALDPREVGPKRSIW